MKRACVSVDNCAGCPHVTDGEHYDHHTLFKSLQCSGTLPPEAAFHCNELDKAVQGDKIDPECPLEDV